MRQSDITAPPGLEQFVLNPLRHTWRSGTAALDSLIYDTTALTPAEHLALGGEPGGAALLVQPAGGGVEWLDNTAALAARRARVAVVAGIGHSALGAAALARAVSDALGEPVAAPVPGQDPWTHAWTGWFRPDAVEAMSETLAEWLTDPALSLDLLIGHGRGTLAIAAALHGLRGSHPARYGAVAPALSIVTFGTVVRLPPGLRAAAQFLGDADALGALASRREEAHVTVPNASHHLNPRLPWHLPVTERLRAALPVLRPAPPQAPRKSYPPPPKLPAVAGSDPLG